MYGWFDLKPLFLGFGYLSLFSDPIDLETWTAKVNYCNFASFYRIVDKKTSIIKMGPTIS